MCGRYRLAADAERIALIFGLVPEFIEIRIEPSFNVAPTEWMPVVLVADGFRVIRRARWGFLSSWARSLQDGARMINARAETVASSPAFKEAFVHRRCLVPADGWYEWRAELAPTVPTGLFGLPAAPSKKPTKIPYLFRRPDRAPMALAGLFTTWTGPDGPVLSFTILTRSALPPVDAVHDRMPVILDEPGMSAWLDPSTTLSTLLVLLNGGPGPLEQQRVSTNIGSVHHKAEPSEAEPSGE